MMDESRIFQFISDEFKEKEIPFLLIGGFALKHYGEARFTADLDLLIDETQYQKAKLILEKGGYREEVIGRIFARFSEKKDSAMNIDFLFVDQKVFQELFRSAERMQLADRSFLVPSAKHLIALKLHALKNSSSHREAKDLMDILQLVRSARYDIQSDEFKKMCTDYGPSGILDKIKVLMSQP